MLTGTQDQPTSSYIDTYSLHRDVMIWYVTQPIQHLMVWSVKLFSPTALKRWFTPAEPSDCTARSKLLKSVTVIFPNLSGKVAVSHGNLHPGWRTQVVGTRPEVWVSFLTISDTCLCFAWTLWYLMITQKRAQRKLFVLQWHDTHHHNAWLNAYCLSWSKPLMHEKDRYLNARLTNTPIHSSIIPSLSSHLSNTEVMSFWVQSGLAACKNPPMLSPP